MALSQWLTAQVFPYTPPTHAHQQIPGTPLWLIPPQGFVWSSQFRGLQHPDYPTASLMVVEIPAPIQLVFAGMTPTALAEQAMTLVDMDTLRFHRSDGYWFTIDQEVKGLAIRKHVFAFGDPEKTFMLNATFALEGEQALGDSLRQCLESLVWVTDMPVDPLAALPYELSAAAQDGWQVASVMGNATVFSLDGQIPTLHPTGAVLIVDKSIQDVKVYDGESFCRRRLKNFPSPLIPDEERGFVDTWIDGLPGITCYAHAETEAGQLSRYYRMTALFPEKGGYYLLIGMTKVDEPRVWQQIDRAIHSFRQR